MAEPMTERLQLGHSSLSTKTIMVMGADNSVLEHVKIVDGDAGVKLNWWTCYPAQCSGRFSANLSLFQSLPGVFDEHKDIFNCAAQNLKVLRHPGIVKYVGSGQTSDRFYIVTEEVVPLKKLLSEGKLSPFAVCAGLHSILNALAFLHDTYGACHNNLDVDAITVAANGTWKLFGLEFARKLSDCSLDYLKSTRQRRNSSVISPEETSDRGAEVLLGCERDIYAFGVTAKSIVMQTRGKSEFVAAEDFQRRIDEQLLCPDGSKRPLAATLLTDPYFRNDFVDILTDVKNITLKSSEEKKFFFGSVGKRLSSFPEDLVATQLLDHFLARVVLVDPCAQTFLAWILRPKRGAGTDQGASDALFGVQTFTEYVLPRLRVIFEVHDASIRLILLGHFKYFADLFDKDVLTDTILPQVLLGLKDKDDVLVASSLKALAIMVRLVGGDTVIGGERRKHFFNGNPKELVTCTAKDVKTGPKQPKIRTTKPETKPPCEDPNNTLLQERSSPDGGEATVTSPGRFAKEEDEDWSDWEGLYVDTRQKPERQVPRGQEGTKPPEPKERRKDVKTASGLGTEFDIKSVQFQKMSSKEDDLFASMEPVITFEGSKLDFVENGPRSAQSAKFHVQLDEQDAHGWDVDSE